MKFATASALVVANLARTVVGACDDVADLGFATLNGGTTGGAGGTEVTVTTIDELVEYAAADGPHIIKVQGTILVEPWGLEVEVSNDKTIVGIGADATIDGGGFRLIGVNNVIIRNLRIGNTWADDDGGDRDGVQSDTSTNFWIDHCKLRCSPNHRRISAD
jgi:pectate lyase